jgi:hypothetical protein
LAHIRKYTRLEVEVGSFGLSPDVVQRAISDAIKYHYTCYLDYTNLRIVDIKDNVITLEKVGKVTDEEFAKVQEVAENIEEKLQDLAKLKRNLDLIIPSPARDVFEKHHGGDASGGCKPNN